MPGSIHVSEFICYRASTQPPVPSPLLLKVAVGKREYNGTIGQEDFSFPVMSIRENMVMMLYNADKALISQAELKTREIVEIGTSDVIFALESGGNIILRLQFLLNDEDRKRIQEMRNSALKRKQQDLLGDIHEFYFPDSPSYEQHIRKISSIPSKGDQHTLRKSLSLDGLQDRAVFSATSIDPHVESSGDLSPQIGGRNSLKFEDPTDLQTENGKPENGSSSSVKKMINSFESSLSQGPTPMMRIKSEGPCSMTRIKSESSLKGMSISSEKASGTDLRRNPELSDETYCGGNTEGRQNVRNNHKSVGPRFVIGTDHGSSLSDSRYSTIRGSSTTAPLPEIRKDTSTLSSHKASTSGASTNALGRTQIGHVVGTSGEVTLPPGDRGFSSRSGKHVMFILEKSKPSRLTGLSSTDESKNCSSSTKQKVKENAREACDLSVHKAGTSKIRTKKRSFQMEYPLSREMLDQPTFISDLHLLKQMRAMGPKGFKLSRNYFHHPLNYVAGISSIWMHHHLCITTASRQLKDLLEHSNAFTYTEQLDKRLTIREATEEQDTSDNETRNAITSARTDGSSMLNGWLINQGVRVVIVIIACGAIFLNNR